MSLSFLGLVNTCDNVRVHQASLLHSPFDSEVLLPLYLSELPDSPIIGLLRPVIVEQLKQENTHSLEKGQRELWCLNLDEPTFGGRKRPHACFQTWFDTPYKRTAAMKELCERWRDTRLFDDVCGPKKWRGEMYPIYGDPFGQHDHPDTAEVGRPLNFAFEMERSACALFGVVTYGVHMSIYEEVEVKGEKNLWVWVPTRARTKPTYVDFIVNSYLEHQYLSLFPTVAGPVIWITQLPGVFPAVCRYSNHLSRSVWRKRASRMISFGNIPAL